MASDLVLLDRLVFGAETHQRVRMKRTVIACAVYVGFLMLQWGAVLLDMARARDAAWLTAFCCTGTLTFLVAIRSGLSCRFGDAALTMPQMVFAIVSLAFAYHVNPSTRAGLTVVVPLVLVFGAFILPPRRCVQLGWFATAVFFVTMVYGAWSTPDVFTLLVEGNVFGIMALTVPTLAYLAGQLSKLRSDAKAQRVQLQVAMVQLQLLATHDPLTGLPNRRHVDDRMVDELVRMQKGKPLCLAILDLDRFKRINDTFGHAAGDEVLRVFAREATKLLRPGDMLARWGGEEFLLVMPATELDEAEAVLERIRGRVAQDSSWAAYPCSRVTFSAGLTVVRGDQTLQQALQSADYALYDAKSAGRDRVAIGRSDRPVTVAPVLQRVRASDDGASFEAALA